MPKINFPKISKKVQICFVRKYRQQGKTYYIFYRANINTKVSKVISNWMTNNIASVDSAEVTDYTLDNYQTPEYVDLDTIDAWATFKEKAFSISKQEKSNLVKIKHNLVAFIVYVKLENTIFGYMRKITPSSVLNREGLFQVFLDDSTFNDIKEQKGLEIDPYSDLVFKIHQGKSEGIITKKFNFNSIVDRKGLVL